MGVVEYVIDSVCSRQFCLLAVITLILFYNVRWMRYRLPPRPHGWPVIGNMFATDPTHFHLWCMEQAKEHGPVLRYTIGFLHDAVVINDYKIALEALVDRGRDFEGRPTIMAFEERTEGCSDVALGDPDHPNWPLRRKLFATSVRNFTNGRAFERRTMLTFSRIKPLLDAKADAGEAFDPKTISKLYTTNHIAGMCFNKTYDLEDENFVALTESLEDLNKQVDKLHISDIFPFLNHLPFLMPDRRRARESGQLIFNSFRDEIQKHKDTFDESEEPSDLTYYVLKVMSEDDAYSALTEVEQRQIISDVFIGGVETTQVQLRWSLVVLASYPQLQQRLYQDIVDTIGPLDKNDPDFGVSSIDYRSSIPYLDAFILESTRFGTVAPLGLARRTRCETKVGGYDVPKNAQVITNQYAINLSESEHEKPLEFRPERFLTEEVKLGPRPASYLPFGLGRRSCPGETTSRNTLWMTLVMLLRRFQILPPKGRKLVPRYNNKSAFVGEPVDFEIRLKYRS